MEKRIKRLLQRVETIEKLIELRQQQLDLMREELSEAIDELNRMLNPKSEIMENTPRWQPDYNSMELEDDQILLYLAEGHRTPQTPYEEELLQEIKALKSRGYGIEIPFNGL